MSRTAAATLARLKLQHPLWMIRWGTDELTATKDGQTLRALDEIDLAQQLEAITEHRGRKR